MHKRKRDSEHLDQLNLNKKQQTSSSLQTTHNGAPEKSLYQQSIQIITGSYDKVLHGLIATISVSEGTRNSLFGNAKFSDNFLFNAHGSAIRCLALSPVPKSSSQPQKLVLASGGTDERINLYQLSASVPTGDDQTKAPKLPLSQSLSSGNPKNKELGSLLHHSSSVNALHFSSSSKLLSGADDNTVAICRTRDWTVLSNIKIPVPRIAGRPSGDTAPPGGSPSGVNDFAVHPSQKVMISVGKGEKCMRLWNLVTGKKAGVLNFERDLLQTVGESKWSRGEGRRIEWSASGQEYAIAFERGVAIFGMVMILPHSMYSSIDGCFRIRKQKALRYRSLLPKYTKCGTSPGP